MLLLPLGLLLAFTHSHSVSLPIFIYKCVTKKYELNDDNNNAEKNKATNYHLGTLKAKIAKLKSELINGPGGKSAGSKDAGRGFDGMFRFS